MIKKVIVLFGILFCGSLYGAQIVNVEYIHNSIKQKWDITVPYNSELSNPRVAANMKYLLTTVDVANEMLNGSKTTEYGTGAYATTVAADTVATNTAVDGLIKKEEKYVFEFDSVYADSDTKFNISAAGTFYVDWGGVEQVIEKNNTTNTTYTCPVSSGASCDHVRIGGRATAYSATYPAIRFYECEGADMDISHIDGCLGCIFPTLSDGTQPKFTQTFTGCSSMESIPDNLFDGITGQLVDDMFKLTFLGCPSLTGPSARINGKYLYEIWPDATQYQVGGMYEGVYSLDDYDSIPDAWK